MLYSDILLRACKKLNLVDWNATQLTDQEKNLYSYGLQDAVEDFNNDAGISIGTELVEITEWQTDPLYGLFARIVRDSDLSSLDNIIAASGPTEYANQTTTSVAGLKAGSPAYAVQEIPIRILAVSGNNNFAMPNQPSEADIRRFQIDINRSSWPITEGFYSGMNRDWYIVNELDFHKTPMNQNVICYIKRENEGIIRVKRAAALRVLFDRAIYFPYQTAPNETTINNVQRDPLLMQIDIPTNHISYLINLTAYHIGLEQKIESSLLSQIATQLQKQKNSLTDSNISDIMKNPYNDFDYSYNLYNRMMRR